jgi:DNA-binding transcriptional MerR regulator/methylmalonyl-CoA mutase cobalamin-binding subunit
MKSKNFIPIRYVSQRTGLTTHLIRMWEKRYKAVVPQRSETNRRLYSDADINRLQLLQKVVKAGHSISQVASLSVKELRQLAGSELPFDPGVPSTTENRSLSAEHFYEISLASVVNLDVNGLETALSQAAVHLTRLELIEAVIVPLCGKLGELWKRGELKIINEHMATPVIRAFLWDMLRSTRFSEGSPKIIISTPLGQPHELGAVVIALVACESGWRSLYFGPSLPAEEIAAAAEFTKSKAVALSITHQTDRHKLCLDLKRLRHLLTRDVAIFIGGQSAATLTDLLDTADIRILKNSDSFRSALDALLSS